MNNCFSGQDDENPKIVKIKTKSTCPRFLLCYNRFGIDLENESNLEGANENGKHE